MLHTSKRPGAAVALLHNDVLPQYSGGHPGHKHAHGHGREFCGTGAHVYGLYGAERHRAPQNRVQHLQANGFVERFIARSSSRSSRSPCASTSTKPSRRCRTRSTAGSCTTPPSARTTAAATSVVARSTPSSSISEPLQLLDKKARSTFGLNSRHRAGIAV